MPDPDMSVLFFLSSLPLFFCFFGFVQGCYILFRDQKLLGFIPDFSVFSIGCFLPERSSEYSVFKSFTFGIFFTPDASKA